MARLSLEGRIALVTGADGWMRRGHAPLLAERDAAVFVHDIKGEIQETTAMVRAKGRRAEAIKADVRDTEAIFGFTKSWGREFAQHRITVNAVAPGFVLTDMTRGADTEEQLVERAAKMLLVRFCALQDISHAVA